jgi:hypothetical protein
MFGRRYQDMRIRRPATQLIICVHYSKPRPEPACSLCKSKRCIKARPITFTNSFHLLVRTDGTRPFPANHRLLRHVLCSRRRLDPQQVAGHIAAPNRAAATIGGKGRRSNRGCIQNTTRSTFHVCGVLQKTLLSEKAKLFVSLYPAALLQG